MTEVETSSGLTQHLVKMTSPTLQNVFLNLLDYHFSKFNKLHKIFNGNRVKVNCYRTENISSIISSYNTKLIQNNGLNPCKCRTKSIWSINGQCQSQNIIYKWTISATVTPDKVYLWTAEKDFKKRYHNHTKSFRNK